MRAPIEAGWVVQGPRVAEFERRFAAFTGARHAVASTSCTTSLHLVVAALGLGPGDEVVVPAFTWVSTANVVEYQGATPVFADVDLTTFNIDPAALEAAITERTVGIIPVHLFGLCAEMAPIREIAQRHGLWVLEDAACGFGASYRGDSAGTLGTAAAFSFHPRKSITTGEGGMITTVRRRARAPGRGPARPRRLAHGPLAPRRPGGVPARRLRRPRLQLPHDRPAGRDGLRADGPRAVDPRAARAGGGEL